MNQNESDDVIRMIFAKFQESLLAVPDREKIDDVTLFRSLTTILSFYLVSISLIDSKLAALYWDNVQRTVNIALSKFATCSAKEKPAPATPGKPEGMDDDTYNAILKDLEG